MGLSGISVEFSYRDDANLITYLNDITIQDNLISHCARNIPLLDSETLESVAFGGIALSYCDKCIIKGNRIEKTA